MSERKHTPGPWKARTLGGHSVVLCPVLPGRNDSRANVGYGYSDEAFSIAYPFLDDDDRVRMDFVCFSHDDARLIAAAPELLEAGQSQTAILRRAQSILSRYLQGQPSGLGRDEAIDALLGLLDGPDQRGAQDAWDAANAKAEGRS